MDDLEQKVKDILTDFFKSGAFPKRKLTDTPTDSLQVTNKKYVDNQISSVQSTIPGTPVSVPNGGTGLATLTAHAVILGEGASVAFATPGTSGNVLTSTGAFSDPTFQALPASGLVTAGIFGDGHDGDVTIAANTTLTQDMYYNNLTIATTKTLDPGGYRIFVKGTLTIQGTGKIAVDGNAGTTGGTGANGSAGGAGGNSASTGGAARTTGTLWGGNAGLDGGNGGNGNNNGTGAPGTLGGSGAALTPTIIGAGHAGVAGTLGGSGDTSGNAGGSGGGAGSAGSHTNIAVNIDDIFLANRMAEWLSGTYYQLKISSQSGASGGSGGGGSSGGGTNQSGGGGGGAGGNGSDAGIMVVFANTIDLSASSSTNFSAVGGNGGQGGQGGNGQTNGTNNGGGGAGGSGGTGGAGGVIVIVYKTLTGSFTMSVAGGNGGALGSAGTGGTNQQPGNTGANGVAGSLYEIIIS